MSPHLLHSTLESELTSWQPSHLQVPELRLLLLPHFESPWSPCSSSVRGGGGGGGAESPSRVLASKKEGGMLLDTGGATGVGGLGGIA